MKLDERDSTVSFIADCVSRWIVKSRRLRASRTNYASRKEKKRILLESKKKCGMYLVKHVLLENVRVGTKQVDVDGDAVRVDNTGVCKVQKCLWQRDKPLSGRRVILILLTCTCRGGRPDLQVEQ